MSDDMRQADDPVRTSPRARFVSDWLTALVASTIVIFSVFPLYPTMDQLGLAPIGGDKGIFAWFVLVMLPLGLTVAILSIFLIRRSGLGCSRENVLSIGAGLIFALTLFGSLTAVPMLVFPLATSMIATLLFFLFDRLRRPSKK
jgi:hypothetical protein